MRLFAVLVFLACSVVLVFGIRFPGAALVGGLWLLMFLAILGLFAINRVT